MIFQHLQLANGGWQKLSFFEQMAHIGSEVGRAINWLKKKNPEYSRLAAQRALELLFFTTSDPRNIKRLKELTRLYEFLVDYFFFNNQYSSSEMFWNKYFYAFTYASVIKSINE